MNLCIDIGNTCTKAALYDNGTEVAYYKPFGIAQLKNILGTHTPKVLVCKTGKDEEMEAFLLQNYGSSVFLSDQTPLPITLAYDTPHTLGRDRIATSVAAYSIDSQATWLIVDLGTCLTIDLVQKGVFQGGLISPGVQMRLRAMHEFTAGLPLVAYDYNVRFPGKSTHESLQVGVCQGIAFEIEGYIQEQSNKFDRLKVIDCSSIQLHFVKEVKNKIFARPKLVLEGLHHIIEYNAKK